jgi:hypothetical protein
MMTTVSRGCLKLSSRELPCHTFDIFSPNAIDCIFFVDDWLLKTTATSCGFYDMKDGKVYSPLPTTVSWEGLFALAYVLDVDTFSSRLWRYTKEDYMKLFS